MEKTPVLLEDSSAECTHDHRPAGPGSIGSGASRSSQDTDEDYFETQSHHSESLSERKCEAFDSTSDVEPFTDDVIVKSDVKAYCPSSDGEESSQSLSDRKQLESHKQTVTPIHNHQVTKHPKPNTQTDTPSESHHFTRQCHTQIITSFESCHCTRQPESQIQTVTPSEGHQDPGYPKSYTQIDSLSGSCHCMKHPGSYTQTCISSENYHRTRHCEFHPKEKEEEYDLEGEAQQVVNGLQAKAQPENSGTLCSVYLKPSENLNIKRTEQIIKFKSACLESKSEDCLACTGTEVFPLLSQPESHHSLPDIHLEANLNKVEEAAQELSCSVPSIVTYSQNCERQSSLPREDGLAVQNWKNIFHLDLQSCQHGLAPTSQRSVAFSIARTEQWHSVPELINLPEEKENGNPIDYLLQKIKLRKSGCIIHLPETPCEIQRKTINENSFQTSDQAKVDLVPGQMLTDKQRTGYSHWAVNVSRQTQTHNSSIAQASTLEDAGPTTAWAQERSSLQQQSSRYSEATHITPDSELSERKPRETASRNGWEQILNPCHQTSLALSMSKLEEGDSGPVDISVTCAPAVGRTSDLEQNKSAFQKGRNFESESSASPGDSEQSQGFKEETLAEISGGRCITEEERDSLLQNLSCTSSDISRNNSEQRAAKLFDTVKLAAETNIVICPELKPRVITVLVEQTGIQATQQQETCNISVTERTAAHLKSELRGWELPPPLTETKTPEEVPRSLMRESNCKTHSLYSEPSNTPHPVTDIKQEKDSLQWKQEENHSECSIMSEDQKIVTVKKETSTGVNVHIESAYDTVRKQINKPLPNASSYEFHKTILGLVEDFSWHVPSTTGSEKTSTEQEAEWRNEKETSKTEASASEAFHPNISDINLLAPIGLPNNDCNQKSYHVEDHQGHSLISKQSPKNEEDKNCTISDNKRGLCKQPSTMERKDCITEDAENISSEQLLNRNIMGVFNSVGKSEGDDTALMVLDNSSMSSINSEEMEENDLHFKGSNSSLYKAVQKQNTTSTPKKPSKFLVFTKLASFKKVKSIATENEGRGQRHSCKMRAEDCDLKRDEEDTESLQSYKLNSSSSVTVSPSSKDSAKKMKEVVQSLECSDDDDDVFESSFLFNKSMRKASRAGRIDLDDYVNSRTAERRFTNSVEAAELEGPEEQDMRKSSSENEESKSRASDGKKFRMRLTLAQKTFSNFFESKPLEKESVDQNSKGSSKMEREKPKSRQSSRKMFQKSKMLDTAKSPITINLSVPQEILPNKISHLQHSSSCRKSSTIEKQQCTNGQTARPEISNDTVTKVNPPGPCLEYTHDTISEKVRRNKDPPKELPEYEISEALGNKLDTYSEDFCLSSPSPPSDSQLALNQLTHSSPQISSTLEGQDIPSRPMSPKPQSIKHGSQYRSFRCPSRGSAISMMSLGNGFYGDGYSEVPERPKTLKPQGSLLLSLNSLDTEHHKDDSGISSQSQSSLNIVSSVNDVLKEEANKQTSQAPTERRQRDQPLPCCKKRGCQMLPSQNPSSNTESKPCTMPLLNTEGPAKDRSSTLYRHCSFDDLWTAQQKNCARKLEKEDMQTGSLKQEAVQVRNPVPS
ncbi:uncharacterized protein LOC115099629 [Rhinatrema bivittatum]|uniref:uncharacterized protein LOC115099629 n=1 Tax=Rhinatrema bivittatum TaxID=194408 RepID=UPI00112CC36D|nr:uncharacterized protein LOC115099629 [Rhinatrema bivittatum]